MTHLIDDKTVAKMGHPVVMVRSNVNQPPEVQEGTVGVYFGLQMR